MVTTVERLEGAYAEVSKFLAQWRQSETVKQPLTFCVVTASEKAHDVTQWLQGAGVKTVATTAQSNTTDGHGVVYPQTSEQGDASSAPCARRFPLMHARTRWKGIRAGTLRDDTGDGDVAPWHITASR